MDGEMVGATSSVAYGYTAEKIMAFAYIKPEAACRKGAEVVIAGEPRSRLSLVSRLRPNERAASRAGLRRRNSVCRIT